jgi:hypothetical protein
MRSAFAVVSFLLAAASTAGSAATLALDAAQVSRLDALPVGQSVVLDDFPDGRGGSARLRFTRIDVYAPDARLLASGPDGTREVPRSARVELIGYDASGSTRAQLAFGPGFSHVAGAGSSPAGAFAVSARADANGPQLVVVPAEAALPAGFTPQVVAGEDALPAGASMPDALTLALAPTPAGAAPRGATIAVDVDHELLVNRFGGTGSSQLAAAADWIADLFATMNVMYQRDLDVTLEIGTTIFRTGATPYTISANAPASGADLNNFGTYWQNNHGGVVRDFTMLLSGQPSSAQSPGFTASGIAWINAYCKTQSSGGSYSVNKVFTSPQVAVDLSARIVGHELGHNFGAAHTHCTDVNTGHYMSSTNTIDQCYRGESGSGCYGGAVSCPSAGPGQPRGTLMSYCNQAAPNGAGCGQNVLQFHPTQVATLSALIAANTPSCLSASADLVFRNGFD